MELSDLAQRLLQLHAQEPHAKFYGVRILGGMFRDGDLDRLDKAYDELLSKGLLENSSTVVSFFGVPRTLYKISVKGLEQVRQESVA